MCNYLLIFMIIVRFLIVISHYFQSYGIIISSLEFNIKEKNVCPFDIKSLIISCFLYYYFHFL